jgi:hypothetical protein
MEERKGRAEEVRGVLMFNIGIDGWPFRTRSKSWFQWMFFPVRW